MAYFKQFDPSLVRNTTSDVTDFLTSILDAASEHCIFATDLEGIILLWNEGARRVYGYEPQEMIGHVKIDTLFPLQKQAFKTALEVITLALKQGKWEGLLNQQRKNSLIFPARVTITLRHDREENVVGLLIISNDISREIILEDLQFEELKAARAIQIEANEQLRRVNELQKNFIAIVSHEFRTTLTGIVGFSELLHDQDWSPEEVRDFAADINTDAQRLNRMINDVLDVGQLQSGKMVFHLEPLDINVLLKEIIEHMCVATQHTILLRQDASPLLIEGNRDKLIQVVTNLLSNAIKYSPKGGDILVTSQREGQNAHVCIQDQGIGIPADALERIFIPYNRIESEKTHYVQGTGLGLTIVREMISMHKGRVWAESTPGEGSQFHFILPLLPLVETG